MTIRIAIPPQVVKLKIPVMSMRKPQSPKIQIWLTMTKAEIALSTASKTIERTVAEMD